MEAKSKISDTAMRVLEDCATYVGRYESELFAFETLTDFTELGMQSPLEHVLFAALTAVVRINEISLSKSVEGVNTPGITIIPQAKIGGYRADFLVSDYSFGAEKSNLFRSVVVECDGTAFHERTEVERRNEKRRDRFMQKMNLKVFRYTGKEILDDPYKIAVEILGYVTDLEENIVSPQRYFE
jgi:very-short-patch-repair endonuclease